MSMILFTAASRQFTKSVGGKSLHPVLDLNLADRVNPLCLVKERKSIWPWKKPKMTPALVSLNDVLVKPIPNVNQFISKKKFIEGYSETPQFKVDGDIGSKIAEELSLDISTVDSFNAEVKFGDIIKYAADWEKLQRQLTQESFNMNHELWLEVKNKKRTNICIVVESLKNAGESSLSGDADEKGSASANVNVPCPSRVTVDVHTKGDVEKKRHLNFNIPADTVLAYGCTRLAVNDSGKIRMQVQLDMLDAAPLIPPSEEDGIDAVAQKQLVKLKESKEKSTIVNCFLNLLLPDVIKGLFEVFAVAEATASDDLRYSRKLSGLKEEIGGDSKAWIELLSSVGFLSSDDNAELVFPKSDSLGLLECCTAVVESLLDFDKRQLTLLKDCSGTDGQKILSVLKSVIAGRTPVENAGLESSTAPEVFLLNAFGVELLTTNEGKVFSLGSCYSEEAASNLYIAVYALLT